MKFIKRYIYREGLLFTVHHIFKLIKLIDFPCYYFHMSLSTSRTTGSMEDGKNEPDPKVVDFVNIRASLKQLSTYLHKVDLIPPVEGFISNYEFKSNHISRHVYFILTYTYLKGIEVKTIDESFMIIDADGDINHEEGVLFLSRLLAFGVGLPHLQSGDFQIPTWSDKKPLHMHMLIMNYNTVILQLKHDPDQVNKLIVEDVVYFESSNITLRTIFMNQFIHNFGALTLTEPKKIENRIHLS